MIIEYEFGNYRSFKDRTKFSMKASSQTTFNDSLIRVCGERILPSTVIYGANASGKSNIISSLETFRNIVVIGSLSTATKQLANLELCPFIHDNGKEPIYLCLDFINNEKRFKYSIAFNVEKLLRQGRKIVYEKLEIANNKKFATIFSRENDTIKLSTDEKILNILNVDLDFIRKIEDRFNDNLDDTELFLSRGFKSSISNELADVVIDFFENKLFVIKDFTQSTMSVQVEIDDEQKNNFTMWNKFLDLFVKSADFGPQSILFKNKNNSSDEHTADMQLFSLYQRFDNQGVYIPAELMESRGTLKLVEFGIAFVHLFENGGVFVLDEFDAALHPEIVKGIISLFNDNHFNKKGAQLIFTTHNPIYLNNKMFRRDQIRFVEKDKTTYRSAVYALSDFGSADVRNDENFLINYFKGKYSSLPFIDFSALLKNKVDDNV